MSKTCSKCCVEKPLDLFYNSSRHKDGKHTECKDCRNLYLKEYRKTSSYKQGRNRYKNSESYRHWLLKRRNNPSVRIKQKLYRAKPEILNKIKEYNKSDIAKEQRKEWYLKNNYARAAHKELNYALKTGEIEKPNYCEVCGIIEKLQGHHGDYQKPLEVIWCCQSCHKIKFHNLEAQGDE